MSIKILTRYFGQDLRVFIIESNDSRAHQKIKFCYRDDLNLICDNALGFGNGLKQGESAIFKEMKFLGYRYIEPSDYSFPCFDSDTIGFIVYGSSSNSEFESFQINDAYLNENLIVLGNQYFYSCTIRDSINVIFTKPGFKTKSLIFNNTNDSADFILQLDLNWEEGSDTTYKYIWD
jgi:hypothetical protein